LEINSGVNNEFIQFIPSVHQYTIALEEASQCPVLFGLQAMTNGIGLLLFY
jgi:hypothetical protein